MGNGLEVGEITYKFLQLQPIMINDIKLKNAVHKKKDEALRSY